MKTKKKLKYSSIPVLDALFEELYKKHEERTGLDCTYFSKKALVNHILNLYLEGK